MVLQWLAVCSRGPEEGQHLHGVGGREVGRGKFLLRHRWQLGAGLRSWHQRLGGKALVLEVPPVSSKAL